MPSAAGQLNILVVDDDSVIRELLRVHLVSADFIVHIAEDGEEALTQILSSPPDLIITDISMPRMDGFELLETVRARPTTAFIPIILLSQHSDVSVFRRGMELGADDFLAKPVKRHDLLNSVAARLKRAAQSKQNLQSTKRVDDPINAESALLSRPALPNRMPTDDLDGYRLVKKLGEGGMSQVFLAERADSGERHVLKLARITADEDGEVMQRFIAEYALVSQINHPNVARIFHQGFSETHAYIAMEYFPEGDLRKLIQLSHTLQHTPNNTLTPDTAVAILIQVAAALDAVHKGGVVHRDMKPDNIMLRTDGSLALADFGIAKHAQTDLYLTAHGEVFGTPVYIAPEQATGQEVDQRADIYSLGAMFFELLTGKPPYHARDAQTMLEQHVNAPLPTLPSHLRRFAPLIERMLAKDPDERPDSALAVLAELGPLFNAPSISSVATVSADQGRIQNSENSEKDKFSLIERINHAAGLSLALSLSSATPQSYRAVSTAPNL
jgi:eukaryotic-like serine/threonine-protein kinase